MTCAHCDLGTATIELFVDGVGYLLCDDCAKKFDHPAYTAEDIVHRLAEMGRRHQRTEELTSH